MDQINIDQDTLAAFRNGAAENGAAASDGSPDSQSFDERATAALRGIDKSLKWLIDSGDKRLKDAGGDGIGGSQSKEDYHELVMINVEEWARDLEDLEIIKKSPRIMLGLVTANILLPNIYDIYKASKNNDPPELKQEPKTEKESSDE